MLLRTTLVFILLSASPVFADETGILVYSRLTHGHWQIWRHDLASGQDQQLTTSSTDKRLPTFGPDGSVIFRTNNDEARRIAPDGGEHPLWPSLWPVADAAWSPSSQRWVMTRIRTDIPDAGNVWLAGEGFEPSLVTDAPGLQLNPSWSPDGRQIVYSGGRGIHTYELFVMPVEGGAPERLTDNRHHEFFPAWSPDGAWIAYSADPDGDFDIWLMRTDGSDARKLTDVPGLDSRPAWSPDGRRIAFATQRRGKLEIWIMDRDGGNQEPLIAGEAEACDPAWQ